jgi:Sec-independent protein translocase protein TatA
MDPLAFLNLGLPETLVIAGVLLLLFAPGAARTLGGVARTFFDLKRGVDSAKRDLTSTVSREIHNAIGGAGEKPRRKPTPKDDA